MVNLIDIFFYDRFIYIIKKASDKISEDDIVHTYLASIECERNPGTQDCSNIELPSNVVRWKTFTKKFKEIKLNSQSLIYEMRNFDKKKQFQTENECRDYIYRILDWIFNDNLFIKGNERLRMFKFIYQQRNSDCDLILSKTDNPKDRFVDIEIKKPNVINKSKFNGRELYDCIDANRYVNVEKCVKQIYNYMSKDKLKYGILSTLNESWFFKLTKDDKGVETLAISDTIDKTDLLKAIYYLIREIIEPEYRKPSNL